MFLWPNIDFESSYQGMQVFIILDELQSILIFDDMLLHLIDIFLVNQLPSFEIMASVFKWMLIVTIATHIFLKCHLSTHDVLVFFLDQHIFWVLKNGLNDLVILLLFTRRTLDMKLLFLAIFCSLISVGANFDWVLDVIKDTLVTHKMVACLWVLYLNFFVANLAPYTRLFLWL